MKFNPYRCLTITKAIIDLTDTSGGSNSKFSKRPLYKNVKYDDDAIVFYREDKQTYLEYHNKPLYVTTFVNDEESRRTVSRSGVLFRYHATFNPQGSGNPSRTYGQATNWNIKLGGDAPLTVAILKIDLPVGPIRQPLVFISLVLILFIICSLGGSRSIRIMSFWLNISALSSMRGKKDHANAFEVPLLRKTGIFWGCILWGIVKRQESYATSYSRHTTTSEWSPMSRH